MNKFFYLAIFLPGCLYAIIDGSRVLTDSTRNVILFSDDHSDFPQSDARQLECFTKTLAARQKKNMRPLHILVEEPIMLQKYLLDLKVTTGLIKAVKDGSLGMDIENIEIRQAAIAAEMMFYRGGNPETIDPTWGSNKYEFGSVTFVDVFNEFFHYYNHLQKADRFLQGHIGWSCHLLLLNNIFVAQNILINTLHNFNIRPDESILNVLKRLYSEQPIIGLDGKTISYPEICEILLQRVGDFSSALFDLYIIDRIFMKPTTDDIMLIAGGGHTSVVSPALTGWINHPCFERPLYEHSPVKDCDSENDRGNLGLSNKSIDRAILYEPFSFKKMVACIIAMYKSLSQSTGKKFQDFRQQLSLRTHCIKMKISSIAHLTRLPKKLDVLPTQLKPHMQLA